MLSAGSGVNSSHRRCQSFPVMACSAFSHLSLLPVASHPQASQLYLFGNLSNHLSLTPEGSSRVMFPVYTSFT